MVSLKIFSGLCYSLLINELVTKLRYSIIPLCHFYSNFLLCLCVHFFFLLLLLFLLVVYYVDSLNVSQIKRKVVMGAGVEGKLDAGGHKVMIWRKRGKSVVCKLLMKKEFCFGMMEKNRILEEEEMYVRVGEGQNSLWCKATVFQ